MKKIILVFVLLLLSGCGNQTENNLTTSRTGNLSDKVTVSLPTEGSTISSPLHLEGQAPGNWFFEASAPVVIVDWDGKILAEHYISAVGEWMTTDIIPFSGEIEFEVPKDLYSKNGTIILQRHNASGLPKHDAAVEVPIIFEGK